MLRRCCLIHMSIFIICVHVQNYVLCLFMSYLCDIFFIFIFIFIKINHIISRKQTHLFFRHFLEHFLLFLDDNLDEERDVFLPDVAHTSVAHKKVCNVKKVFLQCQKIVNESVLTKRASIFNKVAVLESINLRNFS